jgi:NAD+ diphosphatase
MLVLREDEVLLGRQARWPPGRYSALAGFVEPGESLEEAVAREVLEESGVRVGPPRYVSSQPWPFPASLMLGFVAPWAGGEPEVADDELEDVRWFSRDDVVAALEGRDGPLGVPPRFAIARRLLERCDAVLRVGGSSAGADEMVSLARAQGKAVFGATEELPQPAAR